MNILSQIRDMIVDESGATAIEYALILGLLTIAIVGSINGLSNSLENMYDIISDRVIEATNQAG